MIRDRHIAAPFLAHLVPASPVRDTVRLPPIRQQAFWGVQVLTLAIASAHTWLAINGLPQALYLVPSSLFFVPVVYAALKFGVRGAIPTAVWSTILTLPDLLLVHDGLDRVGVIWQAAILVAVGAFVGLAVDGERGAREQAEGREAARRASERRYRALYDHATDAVLVVDDHDRIEEANAAATRLLGRELVDLRGRPLHEAVGPDLAADLASGSSDVGPRPLRSAGRASPLWVQAVGASRLGMDAHDTGSQVMLRDVTLQYEREQGLEGYAKHAVAAREEERRRIARDLHDGPLQSLMLLSRKVDALDPAADDGTLDDARDIIDATAAELRRLSRALRPPVLDDLGLVAALRSEATALARRSAMDVRLEVSGEDRPLAGETEVLLLRVAQESLHNAERHSGACCVRVGLSYLEASTELSISDDGKGIGVVPRPTELLAQGKLGLLGMQERVRLAHGHLDVGTAPGGGTMVSVTVPIARS